MAKRLKQGGHELAPSQIAGATEKDKVKAHEGFWPEWRGICMQKFAADVRLAGAWPPIIQP
jgi:hypothetical protein